MIFFYRVALLIFKQKHFASHSNPVFNIRYHYITAYSCVHSVCENALPIQYSQVATEFSSSPLKVHQYSFMASNSCFHIFNQFLSNELICKNVISFYMYMLFCGKLFFETATPENPLNSSHRKLKWVRAACQLTHHWVLFMCMPGKKSVNKLLCFFVALWFFLYKH